MQVSQRKPPFALSRKFLIFLNIFEKRENILNIFPFLNIN